MWWDTSMIILIPAMILVFIAQAMVNGRYAKYSKVITKNGFKGFEAARKLLDQAGLYDVPIEKIAGKLTDHYDPKTRVLRLSSEVYESASVAALGIAAHETGHAIQHDQGYAALTIRNAILPAASFGSTAAWPIFIIGIILTQWSGDFGTILIQVGIALFSVILVFQLVTLPVEFNASKRAIALLGESDILFDDELEPAKKVLSAAALTYVAALGVTVANLVRMIVISGRRR